MKLDGKILECAVSKMKNDCANSGREYIGYKFISECNYILVFELLYTFKGKKGNTQFNFDTYKNCY